MTKKYIALLIVACVAFQAQVSRADVWQDLAKWKLDGNWSLRKPCVARDVEQLITKTDPAQYGPLEEKLIVVLASPKSTPDSRQFCCRMLNRIGTEKCVPTLTKFLCDEKMSHNACYALGRMRKSKAVGAALLAAVSKASPKLQVHILGCIANRGDKDAIGVVSKLTGSSDKKVAAMALHTLGRIGGTAGLNAIKAASTAPANARFDALLKCAETLDKSEAAAVYAALYKNDIERYRSGGLVGLLRTSPSQGIQCLIKVLKGGPCQLRQTAVACVIRSKGAEITKAVVQILAGMKPAQQAEIIEALGARGDKSAASALVGYLNNGDENVRKKAIQAIGLIGGAEHIKPLLVQMKDNKYTTTALESIATMTDPTTDDGLIAALGDANLAGCAAKALGRRVCSKAGPALFKLAVGGGPASGDAWQALKGVASEDLSEKMINAALTMKDKKAREAALGAVRDFINSARDKNRAFAPAVKAYDSADPAGKEVILSLCTAVGNNDALNLAKKALKSSNKDLSSKALRALSNWPNAGPAKELLGLAKNGADEKTKIVALRGYISLIHRSKGREQAGMCENAKALAKRPDEKRLLISRLSQVPDRRHRRPGLDKDAQKVALKLLGEYLSDATVKAEAQRAALDLCGNINRGMAKERKALVNKVLSMTKDKKVIKHAKDTLKRIR